MQTPDPETIQACLFAQIHHDIYADAAPLSILQTEDIRLRSEILYKTIAAVTNPNDSPRPEMIQSFLDTHGGSLETLIDNISATLLDIAQLNLLPQEAATRYQHELNDAFTKRPLPNFASRFQCDDRRAGASPWGAIIHVIRQDLYAHARSPSRNQWKDIESRADRVVGALNFLLIQQEGKDIPAEDRTASMMAFIDQHGDSLKNLVESIAEQLQQCKPTTSYLETRISENLDALNEALTIPRVRDLETELGLKNLRSERRL